MKLYFSVFLKEIKQNETAHQILFIASFVTLLWVGMLVTVFNSSGGTVNLNGWWVTIPVTFWVLFLVHIFLRPAVRIHYGEITSNQ